jgi:hypothetical protein
MLDLNMADTQLLDPGILLIRDKIRFAESPNNPELIHLWLTQENFIQEIIGCLYLRRQHCEDQFYLLLEVVVDEMLPRHWRHHCLNHIYQPLASLKKISTSEQSEKRLRQLLSELSTSCRYVAASL